MQINKIGKNRLIINQLSFCLLFFIYLYPLKFNFFPYASTRIILGIVGFFLFFINLFIKQKYSFIIKKDLVVIPFMLCCILLMSSITNIINNTIEKQFLSLPISMLLVFCAAYFITNRLKKSYHQLTFELIATYIVGAVLLQIMLTTTMIVFPDFRMNLLNILTDEFRNETNLGNHSVLRVIGFGSFSFTAGVVNSFSLLLISFLIKNSPVHSKKLPLLAIGFLFVLIIGMMMARTTLLGLILAFCILLYRSRLFVLKLSLRLRVVVINIVLLIIFITISLFIISSELLYRINILFEYAFEMFFNYFENGELETGSTNQLLSMYQIFPQSLKTWIIGDGYYTNPFNPNLYYMGTDVGYSRLIFYFGILGTLSYFAYQLFIIWAANKRTEKKYGFVFFMIAVLLILVNLKGFIDFTPFVALFLINSSCKNMQKKINT